MKVPEEKVVNLMSRKRSEWAGRTLLEGTTFVECYGCHAEVLLSPATRQAMEGFKAQGFEIRPRCAQCALAWQKSLPPDEPIQVGIQPGLLPELAQIARLDLLDQARRTSAN